jgi:UDP-galactopyranose mutase
MGGHPYPFGPRHFLTKMEHTYEYLNEIVPMRACNENKFWTYVADDQNFYHYPINMQDIARVPDAQEVITEMGIAPGPKGAKNLEEYWLKFVGQRLYSKFIDNCNKKMWMVDDNTKIDHNVENWTTKGPAIKDGPCEVFDDCISAYPYAKNGYDDFFEVATAKAKVRLKTRADHLDRRRNPITRTAPLSGALQGRGQKAQCYLDELPEDVFSIGRNGKYDYVRDVDDVIDDAMQVAKELSTRVSA